MAALPNQATATGLGSSLSGGWRELRGGRAGAFLRGLAGAMFWQAVGKLLQLVGTAYAYRCLGPDNVGLSGTVLVVATFGNLAMDLGLEIVAIRHIAARTALPEQIVPAMVSLRVCLGGLVAAAWLGTVWLLPAPGFVRWVWVLGAPHLFFLGLNFNWFFQATERIPQASRIQNLVVVATSLFYLLCFRPGQAPGSDLLVLMLFNGAATVGVWWYCGHSQRLRLWQPASLPLARRLLPEGRPIWAFNLSYTALYSMGLLFCSSFLGLREAGYYRTATMLVTSLQLFLNYLSLMLSPRIVAWRQRAPARFRQRVLFVAGGMAALGLAAAVLVWWVREPVVRLLFREQFLPAAVLLAPLVLAKFLGVASGVMVWALLAAKRDWLPVKCCLPITVVGLALHWLCVPVYGSVGAAWLNLLMEAALFGLCLTAVCRQPAADAATAGNSGR